MMDVCCLMLVGDSLKRIRSRPVANQSIPVYVFTVELLPTYQLRQDGFSLGRKRVSARLWPKERRSHQVIS
jgi:hypothetical protein